MNELVAADASPKLSEGRYDGTLHHLAADVWVAKEPCLHVSMAGRLRGCPLLFGLTTGGVGDPGR